MGLQAWLASIAGDVHRSYRCLALWPWPALVFNQPHRSVDWDDYRLATKVLEPGDFILTRSEPYILSNFFIGRNRTAFSHLAVYTGCVDGFRDQKTDFILKAHSRGLNHKHNGKADTHCFERTVTHAISEGVVCQDLGELLFHADWFAVVRPWRNKDQQGAIVQTALEQIGLKYNFEFKPNPTYASFYCTQLGQFCCQKSGIGAPTPTLVINSILGLVTPFEMFKAPAPLADAFVKFPMVGCSVSCNEPGFAQRSRFAEALRAAIREAPCAMGRGL